MSKKVIADSSMYYVDIDKHGNRTIKKKGWMSRLFDMNDNSVSASTAFMVVTAVVGTFLLIIPGIALLIEACCNHTIMTDLSGMGVYIGAVSTLFLQGGFLKGWTNYSTYKFIGKQNQQTLEEEFDIDEVPELDA